MCIFAALTFNIIIMEDDFNFEAFAVNVDSDCIESDFDEFDLFGERMEEDSDDRFGNDLILN